MHGRVRGSGIMTKFVKEGVSRMKRILLAIILVICFNGIAKAESWVLWLRFDDTKKITWEIEAAFPSFNQCSERLLQMCKAAKGVLNSDSSCVMRQSSKGEPLINFHHSANPKLEQDALWITGLCLPSRVDPRK